MHHSRKKWTKIAIVSILAASLIWYVSQCNWTAIAEILQKVGYQFIWIIAITFCSYLLGSVAWKYCFLPNEKQPAIQHLLLIRLIGDNISIINPTNIIGGESSKIYLLKKLNIPVHKGISSVILAKAIMMSTHILVFVIATIAYLLWKLQIDNFLLIFLVIIFAKLMLIWLLFKYRNHFTFLGKLFQTNRLKLARIKRKCLESLSQIRSYIKTYKGRLTWAIVLSILHWLIASLEIYLILNLLDLQVNLLEVILVDSGIILLKSFGAMVPAQIGIEEYANKMMLNIIGVSSLSIWIAVSILRRVRQLFWLFFSLIAYSIYTIFTTKYLTNKQHGNTLYHA